MDERLTIVNALLDARDAAARDRAWEAFVRAYSPLLLAATRTFARDRDGSMDAYAHALEALRADDCRRLAAFRTEGRGTFTTWLTVVSHRIAVDFHRQKYGRHRGQGAEADAVRATRHRLVDLVSADIAPDDIAAPEQADGATIVETERRDALDRALGALAPRDRLLVRLRFEDDVPVREIARLMDFPSVFHVYRGLSRVLGELRAALRRAGIDDASA